METGSSQTSGRVAIQGAGNVGGAAAALLAGRGVRVVAWADDEKCLYAENGLDVPQLLAGRQRGRLPRSGGTVRESASVLREPCDVLILAAVSRAFGVDAVASLRCRGIVELANLALDRDVEDALHERGVVVVPDLLGSVGGSLAVEALYETRPETTDDVVVHVERRSGAAIREALAESARSKQSLRAVVLERARQHLATVDGTQD
jgi:glutamate dehydrogenase/leucine dehydrogenase